MIHVRPAGSLDTAAMAELLNDIIAEGGTTAMTTPVTRQDLQARMRHYSGQNAWYVVENEGGDLLGFQWIEPKDTLPPEACDIATFTRLGQQRLGCGTALFNATSKAARDLGYSWINATIRADNDGGLAYYQSRGFEDYARQIGVKLADGSQVDRVQKWFEL